MRCSYFKTSNPNHATYFSAFFRTDDDLGGKGREDQNVKWKRIEFVFVELKFLEDIVSTITLG